ncbi:type IX secretion system membrane protein PorP/SprF [Flavobacterium sp. HSC-61S13]|uniref:PorP/SprF family type IX secretion system membrane protein n=1 Tax=Flavobacterium sp. HSC-61S13 TaxID=2910963 RepID=UPI0020A0265C|nr:type IX secretion system membrane protein PorP/SprF [Flavobacterium sp. HSC-61S13]MCP1996413.1 type IX secretion system PorP/SprF family membrane protein [Flavobacterium sp. HSC-61S13]
MKIKDKLQQLLLVATCIGTTTAFAQQDPQYTQYMYNMMTINPAYTGSTGALEGILSHRSQWVGMDGAPSTQTLSIHSPLGNERLGLGFNVINDKAGPATETYFEGNFSYSIPTGVSSKLAFGLKAGAHLMSTDWSKGKYYDQTDIKFQENIDSKFSPRLGAGFLLYDDNWYVGGSVPNFLKSDHYQDDKEIMVTNEYHYYLMGGYVFDLSQSLKLKPAFLARAVKGAPLTVDLSANLLIQEIFTIGASYRWDDSVSALAAFQILPQLMVGYSYDYSTTDFQKYNKGSHELVLRYQMGKKYVKTKSPRFF